MFQGTGLTHLLVVETHGDDSAESITVPAGKFMALHNYNIIDFRFTNVPERTAAIGREDIHLTKR
jgi:hypothetical protein